MLCAEEPFVNHLFLTQCNDKAGYVHFSVDSIFTDLSGLV